MQNECPSAVGGRCKAVERAMTGFVRDKLTGPKASRLLTYLAEGRYWNEAELQFDLYHYLSENAEKFALGTPCNLRLEARLKKSWTGGKRQGKADISLIDSALYDKRLSETDGSLWGKPVQSIALIEVKRAMPGYTQQFRRESVESDAKKLGNCVKSGGTGAGYILYVEYMLNGKRAVWRDSDLDQIAKHHGVGILRWLGVHTGDIRPYPQVRWYPGSIRNEIST